MTSVNNNYGAAVALQNLNATNRQLEMTQSRINTGMKVASARDNAAVWAIAETQRTRVNSLSAVNANMNQAASAIDVGIAAGEAVNDLLQQMREKAQQAASTTLTADQRNALDRDFTALRDQIDTVVNAATFNGISFVNTTATQSITISDQTTGTMGVSGGNLALGATSLGVAAAQTIGGGTVDNATIAMASIDTALGSVRATLSRLGAGAKRLEVQQNFNTKLSDTLEKSVSSLVDADLAKESARLQSLQIKQQLGTQALSIANQAPSMVLSLFR